MCKINRISLVATKKSQKIVKFSQSVVLFIGTAYQHPKGRLSMIKIDKKLVSYYNNPRRLPYSLLESCDTIIITRPVAARA